MPLQTQIDLQQPSATREAMDAEQHKRTKKIAYAGYGM